ncbi:hypothetical protein [Methanobrevibacter sp.]
MESAFWKRLGIIVGRQGIICENKEQTKMIDIGTLVDRLTEIRADDKFYATKCTGKNINDQPHLVLMGNGEIICIQLDEV